MSDKRGLYRVSTTLDTPTRLLGLPLDEFIPAVVLGGVFFFLGQLLWSLILPALLIIAIKTLKRGQGNSWLINVCYWYLPKAFTQVVLPHTPPSHQRDYVA